MPTLPYRFVRDPCAMAAGGGSDVVTVTQRRGANRLGFSPGPPLSDISLVGGGSFIEGSCTTASAGRPLSVFNPADGGIVSRVASATAGDLERAVASAATAFEKWRCAAPSERAAFLRRWASAVQAASPDIARILTLENGTLRIAQ